MNTLDTEIILNQDGNFYKRSVVTTLLQDQETAIQRVKAKPIFFTSPVMHASQHDNVVGTHVLQYVDGQSKDHMLCSQIKSLPFLGASLVNNRTGDNNFVLHCSNRQNQPYPTEWHNEDEDREVICGRDLDIKFEPNQDQALYILCDYKELNRGVLKSEAPTLFLYDMHHQRSYHLNLPNVFTNKGEICAGDNYPRQANGPDSLQFHYEHLNSLFTSHCNNDLRDVDVEETSLRFRRDGTLIHNDLSDIKHKKFYHDVTRESILNFTTHLNSIYG